MSEFTKAGVDHEKYQRLIKAAQALPTIQVAVAHPCDDVSLQGVIEATGLRLIEPILVGPETTIRNVAARAGLDISRFQIVTSEHSHDSAAKAVGLVTSGRVEALMKGSLHTDELIGAVVSRQTGIRTARRISHCFIMDVPGHPDALVITDAAINIAPTLDDKVDIVRTPSTWLMRWALPKSGWRSSAPWRLSTQGCPQQLRLPRCARWRIAARSPVRNWMARSRSTTQSAWKRRRSNRSRPLLPAGQISWWCRILKQATC